MKAKSDTTMQILTLHDAIQKVLVDTKVPMTTRELADYINDKSLYLRKDGNLVTASQVMSRIGNYPDMFSKKGRKVSLKGFNKIDLADEQIKSNLSHFMNQLYRGYSFRQSSVLPLILRSVIEIENRKGSFGNVNDFLNSVFNDIEFSSDFDLNRGNLLPDFLTVIFNIYKHPKRNHILQKVLYWLNEKERINEFSLMPEYLCSIIGKLDYFGGHINIFSTANMLSNYVLDIFDNNPESNFKHTYSTLWENPQIQKLNAFVLFASSAQHSDSELPIKHIGVLTPPWGFRSSESRWSSNFEHLMQQGIEENKPNLNRAILIVPEGASFNKGKDFAARKILTDSKYLESVTTIPYKSTSTGLGSVEIMTFNFERQIDHVLLADFTKVENFDIEMDWERVANVINTRVAERDVSTFATFEAIESNEYIWSPKKYLIAPEVIQIKENHTLYRLEDLLLSWKRGKKFDRKKLYKGGEVVCNHSA